MESAGASGFMMGNCTDEELCEAVSTISIGGKYFCPFILGKMEEERLSYKLSGKEKPKFAPAQLVIMQYACQDLSDKEIAAILGISVRTTQAHKRNIREKTGSHNNSGFIKFAIEKELFIWQAMVFFMDFFDEAGIEAVLSS